MTGRVVVRLNTDIEVGFDTSYMFMFEADFSDPDGSVKLNVWLDSRGYDTKEYILKNLLEYKKFLDAYKRNALNH